MWPFRKAPPPVKDCRVWNEDWRIGDIAECIVDGRTGQWDELTPPWNRPAFGARLTVSGFGEGLNRSRTGRFYFLFFSDWPVGLASNAFRKVRPVEEPASEGICEQLDEFFRKKTGIDA